MSSIGSVVLVKNEKSHINNNMVANSKIILSVTHFQALANI